MIVIIEKKMIQLIPYDTYIWTVSFNSRYVEKYISAKSELESLLGEPFTKEMTELRFQS